jgi:hypothetical protein
MLMGRAILILKKDAASASSKMQMVDNGRGRERTCRFITLLWIELRDSALFKKGGVTYVTEQRVAGEGSHERTVCVNANGLIWVIWPPLLISGGRSLLHLNVRKI